MLWWNNITLYIYSYPRSDYKAWIAETMQRSHGFTQYTDFKPQPYNTAQLADSVYWSFMQPKIKQITQWSCYNCHGVSLFNLQVYNKNEKTTRTALIQLLCLVILSWNGVKYNIYEDQAKRYFMCWGNNCQVVPSLLLTQDLTFGPCSSVQRIFRKLLRHKGLVSSFSSTSVNQFTPAPCFNSV